MLKRHANTSSTTGADTQSSVQHQFVNVSAEKEEEEDWAQN